MERVLEPEVMSDIDEAIEYDAMDFSPTDDLFVERAANLAPSAKWIVDIGAGNGKISQAVSKRLAGGNRICALDMSKEMLSLTSGRRQEDLPMLMIAGDAKCLPFRDSSMDLILSNSLIHHVPVPVHAFREMARVVRPRGGILIRDLIRPQTQQQLELLVDQYSGGWRERQRRLLADSLRAALTLPEVRQCLDDCGLADVRVDQITDRHWSAERSAT